MCALAARTLMNVRRRPDRPRTDWRTRLRVVPQPQTLTLAELACRWLDREEQRGRRGMRDARSAVEVHIVRQLGELEAREVDVELVRAWLLAQVDDGYAPQTVWRHKSYLSAVLDYAVEVGAAERNAVRDLPRGVLPPRRARDPGRSAREVLSWPEVQRLLDASPVYRRIFWALLLYTGARYGEGAALRWSDLREREPLPELTIQRSWECRVRTMHPTKTGTVRHVPVHPELQALLRTARTWYRDTFGAEPGPDDLIAPFVAQRGRAAPEPWHETSALKWFRVDLTRAGIADPGSGPRRLHSTRHSFVSALVSAGVPDRVWQTITHEPPATCAADLYAHASWSCLSQAVLRLGDA